jgi:ankyrin repeat protein
MGRTALYLAAANDGSSATVRYLLEHGAKAEGQTVVAAAMANDLASVRLLVEKGGSIDERDKFGRTPLMLAAGNGKLPSSFCWPRAPMGTPAARKSLKW